MENLTSTNNTDITLQGNTIEERMAERLSILFADFETKLPFLFNTQNNLDFRHHKNHSEVTIPLTKQFMAEDITDNLASRLNTHILYADQSLDGETYRIIGFSKPERDKMYIFFINSLMYGVVEEVIFDLYESMEYMLIRLRDIVLSIEDEQKTTQQSILLERMSMSEILSVFNL